MYGPSWMVLLLWWCDVGNEWSEPAACGHCETLRRRTPLGHALDVRTRPLNTAADTKHELLSQSELHRPWRVQWSCRHLGQSAFHSSSSSSSSSSFNKKVVKTQLIQYIKYIKRNSEKKTTLIDKCFAYLVEVVGATSSDGFLLPVTSFFHHHYHHYHHLFAQYNHAANINILQLRRAGQEGLISTLTAVLKECTVVQQNN